MTNSQNIVRIEAASIGTSGELQKTLVEQLDTSGGVRIEVGTIERIDTATLQLLAAFIRELTAASRSVEWTARSEVLERAAQSLGLSAALALPAAAP